MFCIYGCVLYEGDIRSIFPKLPPILSTAISTTSLSVLALTAGTFLDLFTTWSFVKAAHDPAERLIRDVLFADILGGSLLPTVPVQTQIQEL
jgi:hypothetical protein